MGGGGVATGNLGDGGFSPLVWHKRDGSEKINQSCLHQVFCLRPTLS